MRAGAKLLLAAAALALLAQHQLGRHFFERECQANEGAWAKPILPADSLAYDRSGTNYGLDARGCAWQICVAGLIGDDNRRAFVEVLVREPDAEYLSAQTGWHRYWLAPRDDPACAAFYAAKFLRARWRDYLTGLRPGSRRRDPDALCIAARKIDAPASRYVQKVRRYAGWRPLGLDITRYEIVDRRNGDVRLHLQKTEYFGSWLHEAADWLVGHLTGAVQESCGLPSERYVLPAEAYEAPRSSLGSFPDEDWPILPLIRSGPRPAAPGDISMPHIPHSADRHARRSRPLSKGLSPPLPSRTKAPARSSSLIAEPTASSSTTRRRR